MDTFNNIPAIIYIIFGVAVTFALLALFIILFLMFHYQKVIKHQMEIRELEQKKQKDLLSATLATQENVRKRIGADIHDGIGPLLSTFKLYFNNLQYATDQTKFDAQIKQLNGELDDIIQQIRTVSRELVPAVLMEFGLVAAIEDVCEKIDRAGTIKVHFDTNVEQITIDQTTALHLYRIVQELINNTIKHAEANELAVDLNKRGQTLSIQVADNGKGFPMNAAGQADIQRAGLGIKNIKARASLIDAEFSIHTNQPKGSLMKIHYLY